MNNKEIMPWLTALTLIPALASGVGAMPETIEPSGTATAESATVESGVVYPDKTNYKPQAFKDELAESPLSQAEKTRLEALKFPQPPRVGIKKFLKTLPFPKGRPILSRGRLLYLDSQPLRESFPNHVFYLLRFPQWPLPLDPPPPLAANNIFVMTVNQKKGASAPLTNSEQLKQFMVGAGLRGQSDLEKKKILEAGLLLAQELAQDGMYQFQTDKQALKLIKESKGSKAVGLVSVLPQGGNSGNIAATARFNEEGKLIDFSYQQNLQEGMRPICQSTKLLDPDPIVRKMAEKDILIMGRRAEEYLKWQREQVSPELKQAIDKIWRRILDEGR
ncbi:MAG: hypothetical protein SFV17_15455 [Candidatus Obscuribacter sp.]|nr:hypothetical protein [Candidatus Obscuribacter sp.]